MFDRERIDVAEACRRLAREGLVIGTAGNVSARAGESEVAVSPTGATLGELTPQEVTVVDLQGGVISPMRASTESPRPRTSWRPASRQPT